MECTVQRSDLYPALQAVARAAAKRGTLPVLSNVLLTVGDAELTISATNLTVRTAVTLPCQAIATGSTTVNARDLLAHVKSAGPLVALALVEARLRVSSDHSSSTLPTLDAEEFPNGQATDALIHTIGSDVLRRVLAETLYAAARDELRPILHTVRMEIANGSLTCVAADNYRLAVSSAPIGGDDATWTIDRDGAAELLRLLPADAPVRFGGSGTVNRISFGFGSTLFTSRTIDGHYPNYQHVIPVNQPHTVEVERKPFLALAQAAERVARPGAGIVRMLINGALTLSVTGDATYEASVSIIDGSGEVTIGLNASMLADMLASVDAPTVKLSWLDPRSPIAMHVPGRSTVVAVLMPVRLAN